MKRIIIYIVTLVLLTLSPVQGANISDLHPVEVVFVDQTEEEVLIETDTGDSGVGESAEEALENLKLTTAGVVYLDTAEYLLVTEKALESVDELRKMLKDSVKVCLAESDIELENSAAYLTVHGDLPKLNEWKKGQEIPILEYREKKFQIG